MIPLNKVSAYIGVVIFLNLAVLYVMFIEPRNEYMKIHSKWSERQIKEDSGTKDIPNIFIKDYQLAYKIKDWTPENSIIWIESEEKKIINKSVAGQVLYPRKIVWINEKIPSINEPKKQTQSSQYYFIHKNYKRKCNLKNKIINFKNQWILCELPFSQ